MEQVLLNPVHKVIESSIGGKINSIITGNKMASG